MATLSSSRLKLRELLLPASSVLSDEMGDNKLLKLSCINDNEEIIQGSSEKAAAFCPRRGTLDYHSRLLWTPWRRVEGGEEGGKGGLV